MIERSSEIFWVTRPIIGRGTVFDLCSCGGFSGVLTKNSLQDFYVHPAHDAVAPSKNQAIDIMIARLQKMRD